MQPTVSASYDMLGAAAVGFLQKRCTRDEMIAAIYSAVRW